MSTHPQTRIFHVPQHAYPLCVLFPLKALSFIDARAHIRRFAMFHFAITYGNYGAPALTATAQNIQTTSPQYNSHRFPASAFLQVAVSKAPAHSISRPQIFASGRFRYSPN